MSHSGDDSREVPLVNDAEPTSQPPKPVFVWPSVVFGVLIFVIAMVSIWQIAQGPRAGLLGQIAVALVMVVVASAPILYRQQVWRRRLIAASRGRRANPVVLCAMSSRPGFTPASVRRVNFPFEGGRDALALVVLPDSIEIWGYERRTPRRLLVLDRAAASLLAEEQAQPTIRIEWTDGEFALVPIRAVSSVRLRSPLSDFAFLFSAK